MYFVQDLCMYGQHYYCKAELKLVLIFCENKKLGCDILKKQNLVVLESCKGEEVSNKD